MVGEMASLSRKVSEVPRETPIVFVSKSRLISCSSAGLLSRKVSLRVLVQFTAERAGPPTAAIPRSTVNFPRKAGQATLFSSLEYFVRAVGINPKLDREVAFGFGESAHVLH